MAQAFDRRRGDLVHIDEVKRAIRIGVENHRSSASGSPAFYQTLAGVALGYLRSKLRLETAAPHGMHDILDGLPVLPIGKSSFLLLRYLENALVEALASGKAGNGAPTSVSGEGDGMALDADGSGSKPSRFPPGGSLDTIFLKSNMILSSTIAPGLTERVYHRFIDHQRDAKALATSSPAFVTDEGKLLSSGLMGLKISLESFGSGLGVGAAGLNGAALPGGAAPDGFVTQADLVERRELTQAFSFLEEAEESGPQEGGRRWSGGNGVGGGDAGDRRRERSVFLFAQGDVSVLFLATEVCFISPETRRRLADALRRSCAKISESVRMDYERADDPRSASFDAACCDAMSSSAKALSPLLERQESLKLRLDLAAQLRREFADGDGHPSAMGSASDPSGGGATAELMFHSHNSIWASLQRSGLKKYYLLSEESTLIGAHVGMRKNAEKIFDTCIP